jgi:AraC-like DNA-binding protein
VSGATAAKLHQLVAQAEEEWGSDGPSRSLVLNGLVYQALVIAAQAPPKDIRAPVSRRALRPKDGVVGHKAVQHVLDQITTSWRQPLTLESLARDVGLSPAYLCTLFRRQVGVSPMKFLEQVRMHEAEQILLSTDRPIAVVAEWVGYTDPYHFSRVFQRTHSLSPSALRSERKNLHSRA